ncbi:Gfo/Idh/MocA family oxidoreductase [candidate division KSB1 bacterium]|nr:Gfo/Idh/MocA family oxidoreductase [candidate division KSB1 bacterium]
MSRNETSPSTNDGLISRRQFIGASATAAAAFMIVPRYVLGGPGYIAPSDKVNIAFVGVGGKGRSDISECSKHPNANLVAFCDVDDTQLAEFVKYVNENVTDQPDLLEKFHKAPKYRDFREMLDKEKSIDAITVSTPDHNHAVIAARGMRLGKHVFCQKPLTHTIAEARKLTQIAKETGVITQMGNQGHAGEGGRLINEWIWDGAIGKVHEVYCWTNRPIWPQGIEAPTDTPPIPETLAWDLWLGPMKERPYNPAYLPFAWRGWIDFGTGAIGDMGAHIIDHAYWPLNLGAPKTVQASSTPFTKHSYPIAEMVTYTFPARGEDYPECKLTWFDGGIHPPRPEFLEPHRRLGDGGGGVLFLGDKGHLMCFTYGGSPRLVPETDMKAYMRPPKTIPRSPGIHAEWIDAILKGEKSTTDFSYSGPLTEMMLLGNIAMFMQSKNVILEWDSENMQFTNLPEANELLQIEYREGWEL